MLIAAAPRRPQAPRTVDQPLLTQSPTAVNAVATRCRPALACDAAAPQAVSAFTPGVPATRVPQVTSRPPPRAATRGRPSHSAPPAPGGSQVEGGLVSSAAAREALVAPPGCVRLATNALDDHAWSPRDLLEGYNGPQPVDRGVRWRTAPLGRAAAWYLKNPPRLMALLRVMTVGLLVDAALEDRIRKALNAQPATCPHHQGQPTQHPTARWVVPAFGGMHRLCLPGEWPLGLNRTETHACLVRRLGQPYQACYSST